jgi:hypothetical protein
LHGVRLSLNTVSASGLAPWLDSISPPASGPTIELEILAQGSETAPAVLETFVDEPIGWLGRTATGLMVGNREQAWFTIEGSPPKVRGVLGRSDATRELLVGALIVALRSMDVHLIHAAGICLDDQALLLLGDSGAGKSTTATALVSAGYSYLGDDACFIHQYADDVALLPLWSSFRLTDRALETFSALRPHTSRSANDDKWTLDVPTAFPDRQLAHWVGRKTLLFLERSAEHGSFLRPLSKAEAVGLLIAQSNALSLGCHPDPSGHLQLLARLASVAQIARLQLGTEWLTDPLAAAKHLVQRVRAFSRSDVVSMEAD